MWLKWGNICVGFNLKYKSIYTVKAALSLTKDTSFFYNFTIYQSLTIYHGLNMYNSYL